MDAKLLRMIAPDSSSFHTVTDKKQAHLLTDPKSKAFFKPFLARERSTSQAAQVLGCPLTTMHYRVRQFLAAGLLELTREEKRKGRAVKLYRSTHDAYFIPFRVTPYATLEERLATQAAPLFANLLRAYADALRQSERYGHHLFRSGDAFCTSDLLPKLTPAGLPVTYADMMTTLSKEDALGLNADMQNLLKRKGKSKEEGDGAQYLLMVALLPLKEALEV